MESANLSSVTDGIIGRLTSAAVQEIGRLWGVHIELSGLEDTISTIKAVLLDAEEKQGHNNQVKTWLRRLEDVVFEADDFVDGVSSEALGRQVMRGNNMAKKVRTFFSTSNQLVFRDKMSRKIESLTKRLALIRDDRQFHLEERHGETQGVYKARDHTHSFVSPEDVVIGRDDDIMRIIVHLLETKTEENVSVVPIVGIGGLGKTTLARLVFQDEKVQKHFDLKMWVCVASTSSTNLDVKLLVQKIIRCIANDESIENYEMELLQKNLRQKINGKRYLLVLDDVWSENHKSWFDLRRLLLSGANGSRIIVTTRNQVVAKNITTTVKPYALGNLDEDESWSLFKQMAFKEGQEPNNSKMVEIGKKVVKKCGGIPLALRTIGRMLYSKDEEIEWLSFYKSEFSGISQDETDILPTLELSYDSLSSNLKHCFAYCSLFPKDHLINVKDLIKLWMAQGFIKVSETTRSPEDAGHEYFMELYWRSFFHEMVKDTYDNIAYCKMHDLMHDLAMKVAGVECVMLPPSDGKSIDKRSRHLSFDFWLNSSKQIPSSLRKSENKIRTFLLPSQRWSGIVGRDVVPICEVIVSNFKFLRTLDLHQSGIKTLSNSIGKLKHLRYLDLSYTEIRELPNSITKLQNLQTLKLSGLRLKEFPKDTKKLINLRHLEFYGMNKLTHMPRGLGQLTNLQTLSQFVLSTAGTDFKRSGELKELMLLNNLRGQLEIKNLKHGMDGMVANLKEKQYLQRLILRWTFGNSNVVEAEESADCEMTLESLQPHPNLEELQLYGYGGVSLSTSWLPSLKQLVILILWECNECQALPPLDQFPSLKTFYLYKMPATEYISDDYLSFSLSKATPLPSLQHLLLVDLPNLKGWWRDVVTDHGKEDCMFLSFPCLSYLCIEDCPKLNFIPISPSIKSLTLGSCIWKPFHQTMMTISDTQTQATPDETSSSTFSQLISNLEYLSLYNIEELQSLPNWFESLTSLMDLEIDRCSKLKYLSPNIQHVSTLKSLKIVACTELDLSNDELDTWQAHNSLVHLQLRYLPQLEALPEGLQHFTAIKELRIEDCNNFMAIPEWISNLTSLTDFRIQKCPNLTSLPEAIRSMTSLQSLKIWECPILLQRCQREKGEDWPKIAHIPLLNFWPTDDLQCCIYSGSNWKICRNFQLCNK